MADIDPADIDNLAVLLRQAYGQDHPSISSIAKHLIEAGVRAPDASEEAATRRIAAYRGEQVEKNLKAQAKRLREVADELSNLAGRAVELALGMPSNAYPSYAEIAADAQRAILQRIVGNPDLATLIAIAGDADEYLIRAELCAAPKES